MRHLDLFSGIGGFALGLEATQQIKTVAFCEIDKYCTKVLNKNWPEVPVYNDIKELTHDKLKADGIDNIDIITGGYPCQPFSVAGNKKGVEDPRHLWPEYFRLMQDTLNLVLTPYKRTWKAKATLSERLVFQLLASVHRTKEKESGQWLTPNAMDSLPPRSEKALKKQYDNNRKGRTTHSTLREQVVYPSPQVMWRTPDAAAGGSNLPGIKRALDEGHLKRPSGQPIQIRLQDQVKEPRLWPTETKIKTTGGTLNPTWVEWLMGYPTGHTDLNR